MRKPTNETTQNILNTLDCLRVEKGLTISGLAIEAELSENTVKSIFKKRTCPSITTLVRLCNNALEIPLWKFFLLTTVEGKYPHKESELLNCYGKLEPKHRDLLIYIAQQLSK